MGTAEKVDLFKQHKNEYVAKKTPAIIAMKKARYLAASGHGSPGGEAFQASIGALYSTAYTIKMTRKHAGKGDFVVGKLEGQYWHDRPASEWSKVPTEEWDWQLLIRVPEAVGKRDLSAAVKRLHERGAEYPVENVALIDVSEGPCVQMLHVGPYDREHETIRQMLEHAAVEGYEFHGRHHEIYLSDPNRSAPENLRTILRMPVKK